MGGREFPPWEVGEEVFIGCERSRLSEADAMGWPDGRLCALLPIMVGWVPRCAVEEEEDGQNYYAATVSPEHMGHWMGSGRWKIRIFCSC